MGTWKSYITVDHIEKERWGPSLVDADWHAFCQVLFKGIEGEERWSPSLVDYDWHAFCQVLYKGIEGRRLVRANDAYKEMSRAMEMKKPQQAQKAKTLWKMKAKDAGEEYYDPECEDNVLRRNKTRLALWEKHLKDPTEALDRSPEV